MSSQPVGYRVVLICLFIGRGSEAVKVGGSVIYGIPFDSWSKMGHCPVSCSISDVYLFYYIFLYLTYFIFLCTY